MKRGCYIAKTDALALQTFAVLMMVFHHLFGFPKRIQETYIAVFNFPFLHIENIVAYYSRLCIAIFAFCSGYGMMKKAVLDNAGTVHAAVSAGKQIAKFYSRFWMVFFVFVPYGIFSGVYTFDAVEFCKNLIGLSDSYNKEWWYIVYYIRFLILFPFVQFFLKKIDNRNWKIVWSTLYIFTAALITLFQTKIQTNSFVTYLLCFLGGIICLYSGMFEIIAEKSKKNLILTISTWLVFVLALIIRLLMVSNTLYDYLFVPFIVYGFVQIIHLKFVCTTALKVLTFIGSYSGYIWLVHTFFAYYYFQHITFLPKLSILIFAWCVLLSLITGVCLEKARKILLTQIRRIF